MKARFEKCSSNRMIPFCLCEGCELGMQTECVELDDWQVCIWANIWNKEVRCDPNNKQPLYPSLCVLSLVCPSVHLSFAGLPACIPPDLSVCLPVGLSICLSTCLITCLPACLSVYLPVCKSEYD